MPRPDLVALVVLALACWRITRLTQTERGPFAIMTRFRKLWGVEHDENGEPTSWPDTEPGKLLACFACGGLWVSAGLLGLYLASPDLAVVASLPFALSAAALALQGVTHG